MERNASHLDPSNAAAASELPAQISVRQRLEWEVSQLADGTLTPERRAAVEAALVSDAALREDYAAHRRVHSMLREAPSPSGDLGAMRMDIMTAISQEPAYGANESRRKLVRANGGLTDLLGRWWMTASAAAAALALGLSVGIIFFGSHGGKVADEFASHDVPAVSQLEVEGPVSILEQSKSSEQQVIALTVTGPDYRAFLEPQNDSPLPSYTYSYGASAVIDTPSRMIIASAGGEE